MVGGVRKDQSLGWSMEIGRSRTFSFHTLAMPFTVIDLEACRWYQVIVLGQQRR